MQLQRKKKVEKSTCRWPHEQSLIQRTMTTMTVVTQSGDGNKFTCAYYVWYARASPSPLRLFLSLSLSFFLFLSRLNQSNPHSLSQLNQSYQRLSEFQPNQTRAAQSMNPVVQSNQTNHITSAMASELQPARSLSPSDAFSQREPKPQTQLSRKKSDESTDDKTTTMRMTDDG